MTAIYRSATKVYSWIGPEVAGAANPITHLQEFAMLQASEVRKVISMDHFRGVFSSQYWRRVRILQEVAVATEITLVCGSSWISWNQLCWLLDLLNATDGNIASTGHSVDSDNGTRKPSATHKANSASIANRESGNPFSSVEIQFTAGSTLLPLFERPSGSKMVPSTQSHESVTPMLMGRGFSEGYDKAYNGFKTFRYFRSLESKQTPASFRKALRQSAPLLATNPLDKIYSLLGLVRDRRTYMPTPNYNITLRELKWRMTKNYLKTVRNLDVIILRSKKQLLESLDDELPSWTPDWLDLGDNLDATYAFRTVDGKHSCAKYRACGATAFIPSPVSWDSPFVEVEAIFFNYIEGLSSVYGRDMHRPSSSNHDCLVQPVEITRNPYTGQRLAWYNIKPSPKETGPRFISAVSRCLGEGSSLDPERGRSGFDSDSFLKTLYGKIKVPTRNFLVNFLELWRCNRIFDSPELTQWLEDNSQMDLHGATLKDHCIARDLSLFPRLRSRQFLVAVPTFFFGVITLVSLAVGISYNPESFSIPVLVIIVGALSLIALGFVCALREFLRLKDDGNEEWYLQEMNQSMAERRLRMIITRDGWMGMAPSQARRGDLIMVLKGCTTPVLLRKFGDGYKVIGMAYSPGIMNGELIDQPISGWKTCKLY